MAKKFNEYGVTPIHLENKYSVKELDEVLKNINWLFFNFSYLYAGKRATEFLMNEIVDAGKKIKAINWPLSKGTNDKSRKEELLRKLREIYQNLTLVQKIDDKNFDTLQDKMANFQVSKYLKAKENGMDDDAKLEWIKWLNTFTKAYKPNHNLISIQLELLKGFLRYSKIE